MSKHITITDTIADYLSDINGETALQKQLRAETSDMPQAGMQITADQGALLAMLVHLTQARHVLEIGTFTGYSALAMASALPEDGTLIACDINAEWTGIAKRYWHEAGISKRIELRLGPAQDSLNQLLAEGRQAQFDLMFIDADKANYDRYYELALQLLRPSGLIVLDNMLWHGDVANPACDDRQTSALRALNAKIRDDTRVHASLLPLADGVMLVRKR